MMRLLAMALLLLAASAWAGVTRAPFGVAADGRRVELITLTNARGTVVTVSTRGGAITSVVTPDRDGRRASIVLGRPDFAAWEKAGAFDTIVGRYANRIAGGGFMLDGKFHAMPGANPANGVVLHSGRNGFAQQIWRATVLPHGPAATRLEYVSPDGENGFPGALTVSVTYTLAENDVLRLDYRATTTKATVVNLTNHSYWNLTGGTAPIYRERLQVLASGYTPTDARQIPIGAVASVAGTPFDLRLPAMIGDRVAATHPQVVLARGIDHNFVLDRPSPTALTVAVRLYDSDSGRRLEVRTTEPGVQIYTGNYLDGSTEGAAGRMLRQGDGIAFETQHFPDSPNRPDFPSTVLRAGETYRSMTEFAFSTEVKR